MAVREQQRTYPFIPIHVSESHGDMIGAVPEWTIRVRLRGVYIPIGSWRCNWSFELHGLPYFQQSAYFVDATVGDLPPGFLAGALKFLAAGFSRSGVAGLLVCGFLRNFVARINSHVSTARNAAP